MIYSILNLHLLNLYLMNLRVSLKATSVWLTTSLRLSAGDFLLSLSPYLVAGFVIFIALLILWRQISQLRTGRGACCGGSDESSLSDHSSKVRRKTSCGSQLGCSGCSYLARCQSNHPDNNRKE